MEFMNKVGKNSRPNGFSLFFGKSVEGGSRALVGLPPIIPDWNSTEKCNEYLDEYSYDLKEYRLSGYKVSIASVHLKQEARETEAPKSERAESVSKTRPYAYKLFLQFSRRGLGSFSTVRLWK
ncbi:hypothetical protein GCK32_021625 [Trichostrongylus colubriformis]|uniref:Uncharacterized protein n=1 Tax=Trichostrongylus colubriformis TaxID=6319 RepID=A0AAN8ICZ2_TRICO